MEGSFGNSEEPPKRAVGYIRVSRVCQVKDRESLDAQESEIRAYCQVNGFDLVRVYRDEGASAWNRGARRPGYDEMMANRNSWDTLVCYKLDRLWRRSDMATGAYKTLREEGKTLVSLTENFDTSSPVGEAMFAMMSVVAELFSNQSQERVLAIQRHIFQTDPNAVLGPPPTGYKNSRENGRPRYEIEPRNADVVLRIFGLGLKGLTVIQIVTKLRQDGVTYLRWNRPPAKSINASTVFNILHNPFYCGYVYKEGVLRRAAHPRLVGDPDFNRVQTMLIIRSRRRKCLPLLVGPERIEVRKTVDPRRAHKGETVGGPTKYVPLKPSDSLEGYFREHGEAGVRCLQTILEQRQER